MNNRTTSVVLAAITSMSLVNKADAENIARGSYHGYFNTTRWKQNIFHTGPYHLFVSAAVARTVEGLRQKPLKVEVTKMSQPINPGAGRIEEIGKVFENDGDPGLKLAVDPLARKVVQGKGLELKLTVRNKSHKPVTIRARQLAIVLVTDSPFRNGDIN